jgi:hypothetical protein
LQSNSFHALESICKIWFKFVKVRFLLSYPRPLPGQSSVQIDNIQLSRTKSGRPKQCPTGRLCLRMPLIQFFSLLVFHRFSKQICATLCRCLLREQPAGGPLKRRLSPMTVQAGEMTNLPFLLDQGGSQERHPVDVEQSHHRLMRKQQG